MPTVREEMDKKSWETRETFAYFGRAFYMASALEVGLAHALLYSDFLAEVQRKYVQTKGKNFDRVKYEAEFDAFFEKRFAQTMGNLVREIERIPEISDDLKKRIVAAKKRRDFLSHHFWRERAKEFATSQGCAAMREELQKDMELFEQLDREINTAMLPIRQRLGIKDKWLQQHYEKIMQDIMSSEVADE